MSLDRFNMFPNIEQGFVAERGGTIVIDRSREKYVLTYNPMGYLVRKA